MVNLRLFVMMVLQFFIWGAWLPLIFGYLPSLGFSSEAPPVWLARLLPDKVEWLFSEQSLILNAFPISAIIGMFFSNQFADRNFSAERFLAFSHFVSGLALIALSFMTDFNWFLGLMLVHCLLYVPTISITNSIAFAHMRDPQREFGLIRMGGTIGWILAAWPFVFIMVDWAAVNAQPADGFVNWLGTALGTALTGDAALKAARFSFVVAGVASLVLALFSLTLPHTPPKPAVEGRSSQLAWLDAIKLLAHPYIFVLWIVALIDSFVHNSYFAWTGVFLQSEKVGVAANWVTPVMSIGQIAEILTMFILGSVLARVGWKWTLIVGVLGHAARFAVYAYFPESQGAIIAVQVLHGICYAFFFATVYIFVDAYLPRESRASAQGLFNVMILGMGALVAFAICPYLKEKVFTIDGVVDYTGLFKVPMYCSLTAAGLLLLLFWPPKETVNEAATH
jgi:MFS family permease